MNELFWQNRSVFVTGATGFVGSWLVKDLVKLGASVSALVRDPDPQSEFYRSGLYKQVSIVQGSLEDFWSLERAINEHEVDTVFHIAAQAIVGVAYRAPLQTFEANIRGTYNLLESCRQHRDLVQRVVVASSDKAYGPKEQLPYTEDMDLTGHHPYEVSKSCTDLITQAYFRTYQLPVTIARCGNIYGGGDLNWSRIVPDTIRCARAGVPLVIRSDGRFIRDYLYVKDVARAYILLAEMLEDERVRGEAFNFSPQNTISVLELVEEIHQLMDCTITPKIMNNAPGEIRSQYLDSSKAKAILNWTAQYDLAAGLHETIDWYSRYLADLDDGKFYAD
ncbi:GDP-mannose 4,6-dehydratase [Chloroflexota bacterium]